MRGACRDISAFSPSPGAPRHPLPEGEGLTPTWCTLNSYLFLHIAHFGAGRRRRATDCIVKDGNRHPAAGAKMRNALDFVVNVLDVVRDEAA